MFRKVMPTDYKRVLTVMASCGGRRGHRGRDHPAGHGVGPCVMTDDGAGVPGTRQRRGTRTEQPEPSGGRSRPPGEDIDHG